jgi:alcohol dehydrogenase class IV
MGSCKKGELVLMYMEEIRNFISPRKVIIGFGASKKIGEVVEELNIRKPLVVTDSFLAKQKFFGEIIEILSNFSSPIIFDGTTPDPTVRNVEEALKLFTEEKCDGVISIGGGSPTDVGKAVAVLATNNGRIQDYEGYEKVRNTPVPQIAINTTAGTGSECSQSIIITDEERDVKMLIKSEKVVPFIAIEDPELTISLPKHLTAYTGIDALVHAIESYVSKRRNPLSDALAISAIKLISKYLRRAYENPEDKEARYHMMVAQMQAGLAFGNSSVALVHGMARPLGAYFHMHHGHSNAVLLPEVIRFSADYEKERYAEIAELLGEKRDHRRASEAVQKLNDDLNVKKLSEVVDRKKFSEVVEKMAEDALASGSPNFNPRVPTKEEVVELYWRVYEY